MLSGGKVDGGAAERKTEARRRPTEGERTHSMSLQMTNRMIFHRIVDPVWVLSPLCFHSSHLYLVTHSEDWYHVVTCLEAAETVSLASLKKTKSSNNSTCLIVFANNLLANTRDVTSKLSQKMMNYSTHESVLTDARLARSLCFVSLCAKLG